MTLIILAFFAMIIAIVLAFWRSPEIPRYWPLLLVIAFAAGLQGGGLLGVQLPGMFFVVVIGFAIWLRYNYKIPGVAIVALGAALNFTAMAFHGGAMPIRVDVLARFGVSMEPGTLLGGSKDIVVQDSPVALLSDWIIIPVGEGMRAIVTSPGDLVIVTGLLYWLLFSRAPKPEPERMPPRSSTEEA
jgi:hypothetical protein